MCAFEIDVRIRLQKVRVEALQQGAGMPKGKARVALDVGYFPDTLLEPKVHPVAPFDPV